MRIPSPLTPGARVTLVAASSPAADGRLDAAVEAVARLGLTPVVAPSCRPESARGYLAAPDRARAADLTAAFQDPAIDGILALRGGYGAARLLPLLDLAALPPKLFAGYSDVTALHIAFNRCGLMTWHTPMPSTEYCRAVSGYTLDSLKNALFSPPRGALENPPGHALRTLVSGRAAGRLCGGNLSLVTASLGTPWEIDTAGKILFLEDVGERLYRIDAMLTQLRNAGKLRACAGILLGQFVDCNPADPAHSLTLDEIFEDLIVPAGRPTLAGLACGHGEPTMCLPLGALLCMDADTQRAEVCP